MLTLFGFGAFAATMIGGLFALRLRDRLHLILGFSAGAVIAVAFFDLLPEAIGLGAPYGVENILGATGIGFLLYLVADRLLMLHSHAHEEHEHEASRGHMRAGSFSLHSLLDGAAIGLAFQVSTGVGLIVALAVLAHDFSDGINTISVALRHGLDRARALRWLLVDALAPVLGIVLTLFVHISEAELGVLLAIFAGFFLYVGASDLVPESHHAHPTFWTTAMTLVGAAVLFGIIHLAA